MAVGAARCAVEGSNAAHRATRASGHCLRAQGHTLWESTTASVQQSSQTYHQLLHLATVTLSPRLGVLGAEPCCRNRSSAASTAVAQAPPPHPHSPHIHLLPPHGPLELAVCCRQVLHQRAVQQAQHSHHIALHMQVSHTAAPPSILRLHAGKMGAAQGTGLWVSVSDAAADSGRQLQSGLCHCGTNAAEPALPSKQTAMRLTVRLLCYYCVQMRHATKQTCYCAFGDTCKPAGPY